MQYLVLKKHRDDYQDVMAHGPFNEEQEAALYLQDWIEYDLKQAQIDQDNPELDRADFLENDGALDVDSYDYNYSVIRHMEPITF